MEILRDWYRLGSYPAGVVRKRNCRRSNYTLSVGRGFLRRFPRLQSEPRLHRLAHHEFLDLAGDGHREFVDEFHIARNLVVRDLSLTEAANLLGGQRLARPGPDPGTELLAIAIVGDAENLHVLNLGMTIEEFLDLAGIEIFAAADHHVLDAPDDIAVTLLIDDGDVAGM